MAQEQKQTIASLRVVGLGTMGAELVGRLGKAGFRMALFDVAGATTKKLSELHGSTPCASLQELSKAPSDAVLTCLPTSVEVEQTVDELLRLGPDSLKGSLWIDCTSGHPVADQRIAQKLQGAGCQFLDVGISGGRQGAANGTLTAMCGGPRALMERAQPALSAFCQKIVHISDATGSGHAVKAVNNAIMASNILAAGEGIVTLVKAGVPPGVAVETIDNSSGRSWATHQRFPDHVLTGAYNYGFALQLLNKDIATALSLSATRGVPAPLLHQVGERYLQAQEALGATADHTAIVRLLETAADTSLSKPPPASNLAGTEKTPSISKLGIKLVVFDMAGTTVNEGAVVYQTLVFVLRKYGCEIVEHSQEFEVWHGANKVEAIRHFINLKHKDGRDHSQEINECYQLFQDRLEAAYFGPESQVKEIQGASRLFDELRAANVKVALNTGYPRKLADKLIQHLRFGPHIDASIVSEEVGHGRPYPYMIHSLMRTFGIMSSKQVMKVGDTVRDIEEGHNAACGLNVGVLSGADTADALSKAGADLIINSVADIVV